MTDRSGRNAAIIRQLEIEANLSAAAYLVELEEFQRLYRLERMQDLVFDLAERIEESGDNRRLADLGVRIVEVDTGLDFRQGGRAIRVVPGDDMTIRVGGRVFYPNSDCPVLDQGLYDEVMTGVFAWARPDAESEPKRCLE